MDGAEASIMTVDAGVGTCDTCGASLEGLPARAVRCASCSWRRALLPYLRTMPAPGTDRELIVWLKIGFQILVAGLLWVFTSALVSGSLFLFAITVLTIAAYLYLRMRRAMFGRVPRARR